MSRYWPQQKVFIYGVLALFPQKLKGKALNDAEQFLKRDLANIDQTEFKKELTAYLVKYQQDELSTEAYARPKNYHRQREDLILAMREQFADYGYRPMISDIDIKTETFWELIFVHHFVTREIELSDNISYQQKGFAGVYTARKVPLAEFKVIGEELRRGIASSPQSNTKTAEAGIFRTSIALDREGVYAILPNGEKPRIKTLRVDNPPFNFMQYVLAHPETDITLRVIQTSVDGCGTTKDLTELARMCGFDKNLKRLFFPGISRQKVHFVRDALLTTAEIDILSKIGNREKSRPVGSSRT